MNLAVTGLNLISCGPHGGNVRIAAARVASGEMAGMALGDISRLAFFSEAADYMLDLLLRKTKLSKATVLGLTAKEAYSRCCSIAGMGVGFFFCFCYDYFKKCRPF